MDQHFRISTPTPLTYTINHQTTPRALNRKSTPKQLRCGDQGLGFVQDLKVKDLGLRGVLQV